MDFWAQHKDFVLRLLAGLGVFLVALIARGITYGDDLEAQAALNQKLQNDIKNLRVAPVAVTRELERNARKLLENTRTLAAQLGHDGSRDDLELDLVRRTLSRLRRYRDASPAQLTADAEAFRADINANLNGGFGQLRLTVRDEMRDEASELAIEVEDVGFQAVTNIESSEDLRGYLLQLELVARVVRYMIDAGVSGIEAVRITTRTDGVPIDGANPEFLQEYPVTFAFVATQDSAIKIYNRLIADDSAPASPWLAFNVQQIKKPRGHLRIELTALALVVNPDVPFAALEEENEQ